MTSSFLITFGSSSLSLSRPSAGATERNRRWSEGSAKEWRTGSQPECWDYKSFLLEPARNDNMISGSKFQDS